MACGILVPQPGIKPLSPALEGRFLTIGPPGQSLLCHFKTPGGHCLSSWSSLLKLQLFVPIFMLSCFSRVWLFATPWTAAHLSPLSMGFSRQEYWSWLPYPTPGDLLDPGIKTAFLSHQHLFRLLHWHMGSLPLVPPGKPRLLGSHSYLQVVQVYLRTTCIRR